ncbi:hypothetical protein DRO91_10055 [Candidatus Heimdallarchaeota archaeon]|nr:MAG: hypothetical protein DRO63_08590 [Candidatus Gerdarchaeota archaeon]RLI67559.1 MAG: hypothetical protein DRO91_10055 [Candidatus Heimdallarchaeota archaeon]RLI68660.1 MAG: hypothetical protein DRP02_12155 [Candidatus Gerdarchaeota archaeon]
MALQVLWLILALLGSFLSGSIPFAVLIGKMATGKDLRNYNVGNPGGFNAVMTYGLAIGLSVIFIDILKGFLPMMAIDLIFKQAAWGFGIDTVWYKLAVILGPAFCILGHNHSPWLKFKGGRGSAVFIGTLIWVNPLVLICYFFPFGIMIGLFKVPTRVSTVLSAIFYLPAALFLPIAPLWSRHMLTTMVYPATGQFIYLLPFLIALEMWLAQLPRHIPSLIAALRGEEWTLKVGEGQQFSEKLDTIKAKATKEEKEE